MRHNLLFLLLLTCFLNLNAQDKLNLGGSIQTNANFFIRDTSIGAAGTPQYDHELYGAESWLTLNAAYKGFEGGIRFDMYNNSNLINPNDSYSAQGIGRWYIKKKMKKLSVSAGYLYDQIGTGALFKAYEDRALAVDNALYGVKADYKINKDWTIKAFSGRQKNRFDTYSSILKGGSIEGYIKGKKENSKWSVAPGFGFINRTLSKEDVDRLITDVKFYTKQDSVPLGYNLYGATFFNTLTVGRFSWYIEGVYKSSDAYYDLFATKHNANGSETLGKYVNKEGFFFYTNVNWAKNGLGVNVEFKRNENFNIRTSPYIERANDGAINFIQPLTRTNTYRLTSRYNAATQELGEQAFQVDVKYRFNKKVGASINFSNITDLNDVDLYREIYTEVTYKLNRKSSFIAGLQYQEYNQEVYEGKPDSHVKAYVPYIEHLWKISRKKSLRTEFQYMDTKQDYGSWMFGLAEFSISPHWIFTVSDMYNVKPKKTDDLHYYTVGAVYSHRASRFELKYVKQVEGIVCSGGVCRLEPAFNGIKFSLNSSF